MFSTLAFIKACDSMWKQSVWSSALAAHVASKYLKPNGTLVLMGAAGALSPTPGASSPPLLLPFSCQTPIALSLLHSLLLQAVSHSVNSVPVAYYLV